MWMQVGAYLGQGLMQERRNQGRGNCLRCRSGHFSDLCWTGSAGECTKVFQIAAPCAIGPVLWAFSVGFEVHEK